MRSRTAWVVVGLDNGATTNNATVLDDSGRFLVDHLLERPSLVLDGPRVAVEALSDAFDDALLLAGRHRSAVRAVGLDTPGPASAGGVINARGATNFPGPAWGGFDVRTALQERLGLPVIYSNDGNAAALYAHRSHFGASSGTTSSVSVIVGTGLGGGVIESGRVVTGAAGMAGELGHVNIPMQGLLEPDQPVPHCNCGFDADAESVASLTGIMANLLPYWLTRFPSHPLAALPVRQAAGLVRSYAEQDDPLALRVFEQQAMAIGRLMTVAAHFTDPGAYFLGGGVVETAPALRDWFLATVGKNLVLRPEQADLTTLAFVPDLDMAGARGSAYAAADAVRSGVS